MEVAVLGSQSLRVSMVAVDVRQHLKQKMKTKMRRSAQLLQEEVAEYTSCLALAKSPPP